MNRFYRLIGVSSLSIAAGVSYAEEKPEPVLKDRGRPLPCAVRAE